MSDAYHPSLIYKYSKAADASASAALVYLLFRSLVPAMAVARFL